MIYLLKAYLNTTQEIDILDATHDVKRGVRESQILHGLVTVFLPGSAGGIIIMENDPSIRDAIKKMVQSFVPRGVDKVDKKVKTRPMRKSGSGFDEAHLQAALFSNSVTIPLKDGRLLLGPWQEVIVFDFDDKIGRREVMIHILGEGAEKK